MDTITVIEHTDRWAAEFAQIADQIRASVGTHAIQIDHIGSTAIIGLAAKDVIDIHVSVENLQKETVGSTLSNVGYLQVKGLQDSLIGIDDASIELKKVFLRQPRSQRRTNVHVRKVGRINQIYPLPFRDFLSSDANLRAAYQAIKLELSKQFPSDSDAYYSIKNPIWTLSIGLLNAGQLTLVGGQMRIPVRVGSRDDL